MKTELELRHLRVFVAVVEAGAHTRAAKALGLSQSTVSETLSSLERTLGAKLFTKSALTPAGDALLVHARKMLSFANELVADIANVSSHVSATLVIAAVESLSAYVLPATLAAMRERWPNVRFEVVTGSCADIRATVASGKVDVGLVIETDSGLRDESILASVRLLLVASPEHDVAPAQSEFYLSDAAGDYHHALRKVFSAAKTQVLGTVEGVKRSLLAGERVIGVLPIHAVDRELREGTLIEVTSAPTLLPLVLRAVVSSKDSPVVSDLVQQVRCAY